MLYHYIDPDNWAAVVLDADATGDNAVPKLLTRELGKLVTRATGSSFAISNGQRVKAEVYFEGDTPPFGWYAKLYVNGFLRLGPTLTNSEGIGKAGLIGLDPGGADLKFDNVKIGIDANTNGAIDAGEVQIDDDFANTDVTLVYDDNGNLTDDGIFKYVYDAWNRLAQVQRSEGANTVVANYEYDALSRRTKKAVSNSGPINVTGDGGNETTRFHYDRFWRIVQLTNAGEKALRQFIHGMQYIDEIVLMDINGRASDDDCDPDNDPDPGLFGNRYDTRYFLHQDRNWNVVALTDYNTSGAAVSVQERYEYTPYGEVRVHWGLDNDGNWMGAVSAYSQYGNTFFHQGLWLDAEKGSYHNRLREFGPVLASFQQSDPLGYVDQLNLYHYVQNRPLTFVDPSGASRVFTKLLKAGVKLVARTVKGGWKPVSNKQGVKRLRRGGNTTAIGPKASKDARRQAREAFPGEEVYRDSAGGGAPSPHHQRRKGKRGHSNYVPGADLGVTIIGDNVVGDFVDSWINPIGSIQDIIDIVDIVIDVAETGGDSLPPTPWGDYTVPGPPGTVDCRRCHGPPQRRR